jgi:hypothetical protein
LAERGPRSCPFEERRASGLLGRCHHLPSALSSRWTELQSLLPTSSTSWVRCSHPGLRLADRPGGYPPPWPDQPALRGLRRPERGGLLIHLHTSHALGLASRVSTPVARARARLASRGRDESRAALPWGLGALRRLRYGGSDQHRACLTRLCCVFRLSQPLDALFRPRPSGLVSCR